LVGDELGGQVDADGDALAGRVPEMGLVERDPQGQVGQLADQAGVFCQGDELGGRQLGLGGAFPPRKCFDTDDAAAVEGILGLEGHRDLVVLDRQEEFGGKPGLVGAGGGP
jgi:hypothetical protein